MIGKMAADRGLATLLVGVVALAYFPSLGNQFTNWDDQRFVTQNPSIAQWSLEQTARWLAEPVAGKWRPLTWASLAADRSLWGLNPVGFRLQAMLLHLLCALLVYRLGRHLLLEPPAALAAALVWALHPLAVEPVCWITSRNYVLAQALMLLAVLLAASPSQKQRGLGVLATLAALMAHELAVVVPLLVALDAWRRRAPLRAALPHAIAAIALGSVHWTMVQGTGVVQGGPSAPSLAAIAANLGAWALPLDLSPTYATAALGHWRSWLGVALLLALLAIGWGSAPDRRRVLFCGGWFFAAYLPTIGIIPVEAARADRWLYMPSVGAALLIAAVCGGHRRLTLALVWIVAVTLGISTLQLGRHWRDAEHLWQRAVEQSDSHLAHHNLAGALADRELPDWEGALEHYRAAAERASTTRDRARSRAGVGRALLHLGRATEALPELEAAITHDPALLSARLFLAQTLAKLGKPAAALAQARLATALAPDQPELRLLAYRCAAILESPAPELEEYEAALQRAIRQSLRAQ